MKTEQDNSDSVGFMHRFTSRCTAESSTNMPNKTLIFITRFHRLKKKTKERNKIKQATAYHLLKREAAT